MVSRFSLFAAGLFAAGAALLGVSQAGGAEGSAPPAPPATAAPSPSTLALSPLNDQIGDPISVIPVPVSRVPAAVDISIEAVGVDEVPIRPVGVMPDGQLEVPGETEVGWYRFGPSPGEPGSSVLAAHVSWNDTIGPFFRLEDVDPGDTVRVGLDDGSARNYEVVERVQYLKDELPAERIWTRSGPETLVLITCGGDFNADIRRYRHNIVVYATPVP